MARAHIDLARAEADAIKSEVGRAAALGGLALSAIILAGFLLFLGLILFIGDAVFGSLGWGVLHGTELLVAVAVFAGLAAVRADGLGRAVVIALLAGIVVTLVAGGELLNQLYRLIAEQFGTTADPGDVALLVGAAIGAAVVGLVGLVRGAREGTAGAAFGGLVGGAIVGALLGLLGAGLVRLAIDPGSRPLIVGMLIWGVLGGLGGLVAGRRSGDWSGAATGALIGLVGGGLVGAFTAISFSWQVAVALGLAAFLGTAPALAGAFAAAGGIDPEALKARYIPQASIDTAKETIEWAKARIPFGTRS